MRTHSICLRRDRGREPDRRGEGFTTKPIASRRQADPQVGFGLIADSRGNKTSTAEPGRSAESRRPSSSGRSLPPWRTRDVDSDSDPARKPPLGKFRPPASSLHSESRCLARFASLDAVASIPPRPIRGTAAAATLPRHGESPTRKDCPRRRDVAGRGAEERVDEHPHTAVPIGIVQRYAQAGTTFIDFDTIQFDADWWGAL